MLKEQIYELTCPKNGGDKMDKRLIILFVICMFLAIILIGVYRDNFIFREDVVSSNITYMNNLKLIY